MQLNVNATRTSAQPRDADQANVNVFLHSDIRLALQETSYSFLPKDSSDPSAISGCTGDLDSSCFPTYLARVIYSIPEDQIDRLLKLNGRIRFIMEGVSRLRSNFRKLLGRDSSGNGQYQFFLINGIPSEVYVQSQESLVMDWTPRTTKRPGFSQWDFSPSNLAKFCVHPKCKE